MKQSKGNKSQSSNRSARGSKSSDLTGDASFLKDVIDSIQDGISILDKDLNIVFVNAAMKKWYAHKLPILGLKCYDAYHSRNKPCDVCPSIRTLASGKQSVDIVPLTGPDGIQGWLQLFSFPLVDSKNSTLKGVIEYVRDITDLKRMEEELRSLSLVDELTGLYNRRGFLTLAHQQLRIADRLHRNLFLIFADLDGLKSINDRFGHQEGNMALIDTSNILRQTYRESDIIARIGGDEFVIMAMETADTDPDVFHARLQEDVQTFNANANRHYTLSISIGITTYDPYSPRSLDDLLKDADTLMYEQKRLKKRAGQI
jgi:diguanylate cyclase (GGDEF)-like protein/PAS domain S-box-containing protein